jgi:hypothetical protein
MIILVSTRTKTFQINEHKDSYITITVDELAYITGKSYYDIRYVCNPDVNPEFAGSLKGGLVLKNKMTEIMVDYVLSDPEELVKVSDTTAKHYRYLTMINLSKLI